MKIAFRHTLGRGVAAKRTEGYDCLLLLFRVPAGILGAGGWWLGGSLGEKGNFLMVWHWVSIDKPIASQ